jgi:hypothetical protein
VQQSPAKGVTITTATALTGIPTSNNLRRMRKNIVFEILREKNIGSQRYNTFAYKNLFRLLHH